jgi:hypothetical protein
MNLIQDRLNVTQKKRSNLFNWRGQFTPEFVEYILKQFTNEGDLVITLKTPHKDKLLAAIQNPKSMADTDILQEALAAYHNWIAKQNALISIGDERLKDMVKLLNEYKDYIEVDLIAQRGSDFLKRQKGQLKLDNSILEEFLTHLINPKMFV